MAERKQAVQKNRIVLTIAKLTAKGIQFSSTTFKAVEKEKSYWLDGGQRRVSKDMILKPYTRKQNDLKIKTEIEFQIWCFKGQEEKSRSIVVEKLIETFGCFHLAVTILQVGISKFIVNQLK